MSDKPTNSALTRLAEEHATKMCGAPVDWNDGHKQSMQDFLAGCEAHARLVDAEIAALKADLALMGDVKLLDMKREERIERLERLGALICHCFEMHDYPEIEAKPYVDELREALARDGKKDEEK